jgi:hypothetical protein
MRGDQRNTLKENPAPCGISILKGTKHAALTRQFVELAISNPFAQLLYDWIKDTSFPEEHFIATLGSLTIEEKGAEKWRIHQRYDSGVTEQRDSYLTNPVW